MDYIYISSGSFGAQVLQNLDPKPSLVITGADKLGGRGMKEMIQTPVKKLCRELQIPFEEVKDKTELVSTISRQHSANQETIFLLTDFGLIIPPELLHLNTNGIWNIHPSLLPKYRGTTPIQTALLNGDTTTGVTLMQMDEKIDHGPIIAQDRLSIDTNDTNVTLQEKLATLGAKLFNSKQSTNREQQDHTKATYTKKLTKEDGFVPLPQIAPYLEPLFKKYNLAHLLPQNFEFQISNFELALHNKIRALTPWPGVWTKLNDESIVKITKSALDEKGACILIEITRNGKIYSLPNS